MLFRFSSLTLYDISFRLDDATTSDKKELCKLFKIWIYKQIKQLSKNRQFINIIGSGVEVEIIAIKQDNLLK